MGHMLVQLCNLSNINACMESNTREILEAHKQLTKHRRMMAEHSLGAQVKIKAKDAREWEMISGA